jgi:Skp family chaperone for outer membrane proteins
MAAACALLFSAAPLSHSAFAQSTPAPAPAVPTFATPAASQPAASQIPIVLGILDTQALIFESTAGKGIIAQANAVAKGYDDDFQKKEGALRNQAIQVEALSNANPPISQAELETRRKALGQQDQLVRQQADKNKQALDDRVAKARQAILTVAEKIVQDIAKARGLTLILNQSSIALSPPAWNITNDAMQRLNKALPAVKL